MNDVPFFRWQEEGLCIPLSTHGNTTLLVECALDSLTLDALLNNLLKEWTSAKLANQLYFVAYLSLIDHPFIDWFQYSLQLLELFRDSQLELIFWQNFWEGMDLLDSFN